MTTSSPFIVVWRAFLAQFLAGESVTSDVQYRRAIIWVLAFLLTPSLYLTAIILPGFEIVRLLAQTRGTPEIIGQFLRQLSAVYVLYSMLTTGLLTVFAWNALVFERRDAMVIGPLPVRGRTVIAAKLAALATFLLGASIIVNVSTGVPYALVTGGNEGFATVVRHLLGYMTATIGGALFVFSTIVAARGLLVLLLGPRFAGSVGSGLQFLFAGAVLCFLLVPVAMGNTLLVVRAATAAPWMPTNWYWAVFERIRDPAGSRLPAALAERAGIALLIAVTALLAVTSVSYWRHMQGALESQRRSSVFSRLELRRRIARLLVRRDNVAAGIADFVLSSLGRSAEHQAYVGVSAAIALGIVVVALARYSNGLDSIQQARTIVLWIPLVFGYWIAIGLRASFFVPSEFRAAWTFQANACAPAASCWAGMRAAMVAVVLVPALVLNALVVGPLAGGNVAAWHALFVAVTLIAFVELLSLTVGFIPYTRMYEPGHAKLKTRWPVYLVGLFLVAYLPVRLELRLLDTPPALLVYLTGAALITVMAEVWGRRGGSSWDMEPLEVDDSDSAIVLNINSVSRGAI